MNNSIKNGCAQASAKPRQKGFSLIELMIVVAIIGILAALAIPQYMRYTARAQASEALQVSAGVRVGVELYLFEHRGMPDPATSIISGMATRLEGKYVADGSVSLGENGVITVPFDSGSLAGKSIQFTPTINDDGNKVIRWNCDGVPSGSIDGDVLSICRD